MKRTDVRRDTPDDLVLPSRRDAIDRLRSGVEAKEGLVLLTGEAGSGKSWVTKRVVEALPAGWRWATVALTPATRSDDFERAILHAFGLPFSPDPATNRASLHDALLDATVEGSRWGLVVEEAHNASEPVLEFLRVLGGRLGQAGTLAGILLVGQTALVRRLTTRPLAAFEARILARVMLGRLSLEEFRIFLGSISPSRSWPAAETEWAHRMVEGNPLRTIRLARSLREARPIEPPAPSPVRPPSQVAETKESSWQVLPVVPPKPPLAVGDGMIEVGWDAPSSVDAESAGESGLATANSLASAEGAARDPQTLAGAAKEGSPPLSGEPISDRYAALQAWTEWAQNEGRDPVRGRSEDADDEGESPEAEREASPAGSGPAPGHPSVWAEGQHGFAPYSQLFTRLRQHRDPQ